MEPYQFPSHYPHQSRLAEHDPFTQASPALDQYPKVGSPQLPNLRGLELRSHVQMSTGTVNPPRHGRSDQVYASPMSMGTMPMLMYPGTSSTPQYSNMSQYPYDNLRIPPTLDNNYVPMSPHYEVLPSNTPRAMEFGVRTVLIYPFVGFQLTTADAHAGRPPCCETTTVQRTLASILGDPDPFSCSRVTEESIDISSAIQYSPTVWVTTAACAASTIPASTLQDKGTIRRRCHSPAAHPLRSHREYPTWDRRQGCDEQEVSQSCGEG